MGRLVAAPSKAKVVAASGLSGPIVSNVIANDPVSASDWNTFSPRMATTNTHAAWGGSNRLNVNRPPTMSIAGYSGRSGIRFASGGNARLPTMPATITPAPPATLTIWGEAWKPSPKPLSTLVSANDVEGSRNIASAISTSRFLTIAPMSRKNCAKLSRARRASGGLTGMNG